MSSQFRICTFVTIVFAAVFTDVGAAAEVSEKGMVATVHPLATDAGVDVLKRGGNAVDAAVAAALTLGVVDSHNSGLGGGCFILIRAPDGKLLAIDGRETAPARAHRDMFLKDGKADGERSTTGPLAVATPGALAAYALAVQESGRLELRDLLLPAAQIAEQGFVTDRVFAANLKSTAKKLASYEGSRASLLKPDGQPYLEGERLKQPDLARTYRMIAENGTDWFYQGEFAQAVGNWMKDHGGILTAEDFQNYRAVRREPVKSRYRGLTIIGFPPPSSGGVHVAQILNILQNFDVVDFDRRDPALATHVVAEAMKLAFADRAYWLGDPQFARVPQGLVDEGYARDLAQRIDLDRASQVERHGIPPGSDDLFFAGHTTHIAAADAEGYWVAITATVNTTFGSKVIVPGTGVVLNNQMDDFSIQPGVPNAFGLVGAEANAVGPGKRPLSSMSPTFVLRDNEPIMTIGAAGGPTIISQVVLGIVRHVDLKLGLDEALAAPRFHHQWSPDVLVLEKSIPLQWHQALSRRGHRLGDRQSIGVTQAIGRLPDGRFIGVHDPRVPGKAAGY